MKTIWTNILRENFCIREKKCIFVLPMKKILLFPAVFLLMSLSAAAMSFPDVPKDHPNYNAIEYLRDKGVIEGYPDGTYKPDIPVNRAEAMKIITLATDLGVSGDFPQVFPDVKEGDWFFSYVMAAQNKGIVEGYGDGEFKPGRTVSLSESLKMLIESAGATTPSPDGTVFTDVIRDDWFAKYALYARNKNMIFADDYGKIYPHKEMDRGSFAEIAYRMMVVTENQEKAFPLERDWKEYTGTNLPFAIKYDSEEWRVFEHFNAVTFLRPDKEFSQTSPFRVYPNSGILTVTLDFNENSLSKSDYFDKKRKAFSGAQLKEFRLSGFDGLEIVVPDARIVDWYIYLNDGKILTIYTRYGEGLLGYQHQQFIKAMLRTFEYRDIGDVSPPDHSDVLSAIFQNMLVEGKGMESLDLLPDKRIIETDSIGIGTGPVDYYYSNTVNYTFKYERSKDVILDQRHGQTAAF